jgi:hypothetical protein
MMRFHDWGPGKDATLGVVFEALCPSMSVSDRDVHVTELGSPADGVG